MLEKLLFHRKLLLLSTWTSIKGKMALRYTHPSSKLTLAQRQFYERNGFIVVRKNVSPELIEVLNQRFIDICEDRADDMQCFVIKDPVLRKKGLKGEAVMNKLQDFVFDPVLSRYCMEKSLVDAVENIIGPNITVAHSMLINKPPDTDPDISRHPMHQDLHYFPFRPADKIVASWTAMQRVDENNGCLFVVPGSHIDNPLLPHIYPEGKNNAMYHGVQNKDHLPKQFVVLDKGDTVFFHPLLLHGSGVNRTKGYRRAISCHFADTNCEFIDVTGTLQENIRKEVETITIKRGMPMSFIDVWKSKSRLVRGPPGNFQRYDSHL
ncbi:phytanoyl-CoA dioxygenase, peroxisomal isoform X2 [Diabrotica virgifera virgifera]|uniref:phytanoyl-CoA dioxygenase n=1 Tax=Diabrotica virgifera virgifera TaxID=50390 RepID=A0A6P7FPR8_DIAVI|nr:phytanoyl-CoA dioxygenase, peroxisomal isoform X2 [Diabrotica virgifera virgifera]